MTDTNRYGPGVSWRDLRRWAIAGIGLWFPAYLRDAERHHGVVPGYCQLPAGFRVDPQENAAEPVAERVKRPEQRLPLILIISPGLTDTQPMSQADKTFNTEWSLTLSGIVHGKGEDEAELMASCYGLAFVQMVNQQAGGWADLPAYLGEPFERSLLGDEDSRLLDEGLVIEASVTPVDLGGDALQDRAKALNVKGRASMTADELREAVAIAEAGGPDA
jgi:hypothetical protein